MNFVIPKKKRVVEKPEIDISSLEPKAIIEDVSRDSTKFNGVKNIVMESMSDRQIHQFMRVEKVQLIKNRFLEYKYDQFKANLRLLGQSDVESYGFLLIGFDPEDSKYIADNGCSVGTAFFGDLGLPSKGVYLHRYVDLVTPSLFYKDELMRVMVFRTLRGRSYAVGLGSTELEPTLECSSHVPASDHIPGIRKTRQQLYRQSAVYHYEYNKDMSLAEVPSGVLPHAIVELRSNLPEKNHHNVIPPSLGYIHDQLHFYPVYEGQLTILSSTYAKTTLCTAFEDSNKPHGLDESLVFTKLMQWPDVYDMRGVGQLMIPDVWGLIAKQREVCVKNPNERSEKWKFLYASHFVWICKEASFTTMVNAMRVEQCAAVAYSIDATTYVAFPSSQFSSVFGLPWLQIPSLHVLVIHANSLFYADSSDLNCFNEETEIANKLPLGTSILDGDDAALCRFFDAFEHSNGPHFGQSDSHSSYLASPHEESSLQICEQSVKQKDDSSCLHGEMNGEKFTPLPPVPLPPSAGKSCLRTKPPQVFVNHPPLIGKSVPPPAPGSVRNSSAFGVTATRKVRIRWADSVVDNENKCRKKLSNDRDEALKAGLHGRTAKELTTENTQASNSPILGVNPGPSTVGAKTKDLFQGVFSTIAKGGIVDTGVANALQVDAPVVHSSNEPSKNSSLPRRLGQTKNCIITSLPLPLLSRNTDVTREVTASNALSTSSQSSEDELTICDMEIESGSEDTLTPPAAKPSPDRTDEVIEFIDDHDEDYDAHFKCEPSSTRDSEAASSPLPSSMSFPTEPERTTSADTKSVVLEDDSGKGSLTVSGSTTTPLQRDGSVNTGNLSDLGGTSNPSPATASEMPENVLRLLELLRSSESVLSRDTDLRKQPPISTNPTTSTTESGRQRKSRFDQPPPELADHAGFVPKPVPTASVGFVGHVPALGSSVMDTDLRSHPSHTLAFSIKKAMPAPALNPPAPLVFCDDEDDDVGVSDDQRLKSKCDRKDRDDRKDSDDKKDRDERIKRWDKQLPARVTSAVSVPLSVLPSALPQSYGLAKEKPPDSTKLFHILAGARLLQSQRDKQANEYAPSCVSKVSTVSVAAPQNSAPQLSLLGTEQAPYNSRLLPAVTSNAGDSVMSSNSTSPHYHSASTSAAADHPSNTTVFGLALGLSDDAVQCLMKRSSAESRMVEVKTNPNPPVLLDAPASPDPEGPASPDAPASPDPEESANGSSSISRQVPHSEIPLDCWQPSEDIRTTTDKVTCVRTHRKPKRPKDHDGISCGGNEHLAMNSWIKALEQKSDAAASSKRGTTSVRPTADDEEEEGEILSDGSDDPHETAQPITVIGASSNNFHSSFASTTKPLKSEEVRTMSRISVDGFTEYPMNSRYGRSGFPEERFGAVGLRKGLSSQTFTSWPSYESSQQRLQGGGYESFATRYEASAFTLILPDFMMFNRTAMTRMDPTGFESFCERLKVIQTQENRNVSLHFHERLLQYIREMMQSMAGSDTGNAFHMYYSVILKYKSLGIVHFMERHACDDSDVCAAQTISCFAGLRKSHHPSTVLIYMSNMSPASSTGSALSAIGVRVIPPSSVMRSFGLDLPRHSIQL